MKTENQLANEEYDRWAQAQQDRSSAKDVCPSCRGDGRIWVDRSLHYLGKKTCPRCDGTGKRKQF